MARFSKKLTQQLRQAGWKPGRRVDIHRKLEWLTAAALHPTPEMLDFLTEFGGLKLTYPNGDCLFDFRSYAHDFTPDKCQYRSSVIGERVTLVGSFGNNSFIVVIGDDGKMYAYDEGYKHIIKLGDSYDEGLEGISRYGINPYKLIS